MFSSKYYEKIRLNLRIKRKLNLTSVKLIHNKIKHLYKEILNKKKINVYDIGAGNRILNELINFDGIGNVYLIDPNKNLQYSYNKLYSIFQDKESIFKISSALSNKTEKINYYEAHVSTSSSFAIDQKKAIKFSSQYKKKPLKLRVYSFSDFIKKYKTPKPDILKIDAEGFEYKILKSTLKTCKPLLVQVETNVNNPFLNQTFFEVYELMKRNNYKMYTILPYYGYYDYNSNKFINTTNDVNYKDPEFNISKNYISQIECYFYKIKNSYNEKDLISFSCYGFSNLFNEILNNSKNFSADKIRKLKKIHSIQLKYSKLFLK